VGKVFNIACASAHATDLKKLSVTLDVMQIAQNVLIIGVTMMHKNYAIDVCIELCWKIVNNVVFK
jgi:hypothetical protein